MTDGRRRSYVEAVARFALRGIPPSEFEAIDNDWIDLTDLERALDERFVKDTELLGTFVARALAGRGG